MSYYKLLQVDIIQTSQLYLGGGINAYPPSTGQSLFSDGSGGTYWSTPSGRTTQFTSTVEGLGRAGYISSSQLYSTVGSLLLNTGGGGGTANAVISTQLASTVDNLGWAGYVSTLQLQSTVAGLGTAGYVSTASLTPYFTSTTGGLGNANYVCTSQLVSTVFGLGNFYISTNSYGTGDVTTAQLISTSRGLGNIYLSSYTYPFAYSTQVVSTVDGLGKFYLSTPMVVSTVQGLGNLGYMSSQNITSTVAGLGQTYISATDVVLARYISTGLSTPQVLTSNIYTSNIYTNNFYTGVAYVSTTFTTQNAPVSITFTSNTPSLPVSMTGPTGQPFNMRIAAGTGALTLSVDGTSNATIRSEQPGTGANPLNIQGSVIYENANSNVFYPGTFLANNNTQILGSTISTGLVLAPQAILSSVIADGSQLYNLTAVSTATMTSTVAGYGKSLNVVSTATLASTIQGLSNIIGYLSAASIGPIVSTALMTTSTMVTYGNTTTGYITLSNPYTTNLWLATGAAATPAATIEYSVDGLTWTNAATGGFSVAGYGVAWSGNLWVAVGQDATAANRIQYSSNGSNWLAATGATFSVRGGAVAWNGSLWVAVGQDGTATNTIKYSANGTSWSNSLGSAFGTAGNAVAWNGRLWVAVGTDSSAANAIRYSYNGSNWFAGNASANSSTQNAIAWNGRFWLSGGTVSGTSNSISLSRDGINWASVSAPFQTAVTAIAWNGVLWIATGSDSAIIYNRYSYDGYTWVQGTGTQFSIGGISVAWNGSNWVAGGQSATQLGLLQNSSNSSNWVNSTANNFTTSVNGIAYSSNTQPYIVESNMYHLPQPIPLTLNSTNSFLMSQRALTINNTVYVDNILNRTGINCNAPSYDLDVYGAMNVSSAIYASTFVGNGSQLTNVLTQPFLTSSLIGLGTLGYVSTIDYSTLGSNVASSVTSSLYLSNYISTAANNSTTTYFLNRFATLFSTSTVFVSTSYNLIVSSGQFSSIFASTIITSTLIVSSMNSADSRVQRELVSSIRMFEADGYMVLPPFQSSNISAIYMQASTLQANSLNINRILLGSNRNQTIIPFYGLSGGFNNTVIMEQSTSGTTQELLLFRGSSTTDQIRVQTTGIFRVETGVSARLYPNNMGQASSNSAFLVDTASNVIFNGTTTNTATGLFFNAATNFLGINTITPQYPLDMPGTARIPNIIISTATVSTFVNLIGTISSLTVSSMPYFPASTIQAQLLATSNLTASTISGNSSFFSSLYVSTQTTTSTLNTNNISTSIIVTSTLTTNNLSTPWIFTNFITTSSIAASTVTAPLLQSQNLNVSSIQLYTYNGYTRMGDLATSNISTVGLFASSLQTFGVQTNLLRVGLTPNQNALRFYGLFGNFNNTVIMEQSTSGLTQELLLFKGSSISDQVRIQTTGSFRVETGVSSRLYPNNMNQVTNPTLVIDNAGNLSMNASNGFVYYFATNSVGINLPGVNPVPAYTLDVNGTIRSLSIITSTALISSSVTFLGYVSSFSVSSMTLVPASTVTAQLMMTNISYASTLSATSSIMSTMIVSSLLTTSTFYAVQGFMSTLALSTVTSLTHTTNTITGSGGYFSTLLTSSFSTNFAFTQQLTTSSLNFYNGPGFVFIPDIQASNLSTIAMYTSSIRTNAIFTTRMGINNSTPLFTMDVLGNARISSLTIDAGAGVTSTNTTFSLAVWGAGGPARVGGTTWTQISDERVKENIVDADLDKCYADIKAIPLRRFTYTSSFFETVPLADRNVLGFIAQEVKELQPKSVVVGGAFGISDLNWLNIDQMNMSLYGAVKKLMQTNEELTSSVTGLAFSVSTLMSHGI